MDIEQIIYTDEMPPTKVLSARLQRSEIARSAARAGIDLVNGQVN